MSDFKKTNYLEKEQVFWKVFGCGDEVQVMTAKLPAGMPYESRTKIMAAMDKKIKEVGGKVLKSGFWNTSLALEDPPEIEFDFETPSPLPF